ncbi:MAG: hypothetical protein WBP85_03970 [Terracidiphilus sp.]
MIEPYETALRNASQDFPTLGFSLANNTEYAATLSIGNYSIEISTDRYYHPGLSVTIRDPMGKHFEIGLVRQILDPVHYEQDMAALKAIRERFGLDQPDTPREARLKGIAEYVCVSFDQILRFLAAHRERVFVTPNEYEANYISRANARVSQILK